MDAIVRLIEWTTRSVGYLAALIVVPLVVATCYEVFARYVFGAPTIWAFELGYTLMGVHFLLGGALTLQRQFHIRIDLIYSQLSPKKKAFIDLTLYVLLLGPCLFLICDRFFDYTYQAYLSGERSGNSAWNPVVWPFRALILLAFVLLLAQVVAETIKAAQTLAGRRLTPLPAPREVDQ